MRKPSPLSLLLTPALFAFAASSAHAVATAPSASVAPAQAAASDPLAVTGIPNQGAIGPTAQSAPFAPGGSFSTDNGNPELGTSPGQTSSGAAAGAMAPVDMIGASATPLLDQATRNAEQRLARERATGRTPRVIGIAPNTDADRTDEMPDDPIIRY